jgi:hypothetical protein
MAIRKADWNAVKTSLCHSGGMHEDFDLAIHLTRKDKLVVFDESLVASLSYRRSESNWREFASYVMLAPQTYALHGLKSRKHMYPVCALVLTCYWPLKIMHRGYDQAAGQFNWRNMFIPEADRVNPATFVD